MSGYSGVYGLDPDENAPLAERIWNEMIWLALGDSDLVEEAFDRTQWDKTEDQGVNIAAWRAYIVTHRRRPANDI